MDENSIVYHSHNIRHPLHLITATLFTIFCETSQFADVTSIYTASKFIPEIEHRLNSDLVEVSSWLRKQKLHLNAIKYCVVLSALSQSLRLCVTLDGIQ